MDEWEWLAKAGWMDGPACSRRRPSVPHPRVFIAGGDQYMHSA